MTMTLDRLTEIKQENEELVLVRKLVAAKGGKTKGNFAKVTCADYKSANCVCVVHQNLCSLTRLCVFIHNVVIVFIVRYIGKMLIFSIFFNILAVFPPSVRCFIFGLMVNYTVN